MEDLLQGLFKLPDRLLLDVVALLSPAERRCLSHVNRRLNCFVFDSQKQYNIGISALPDELVLEVVDIYQLKAGAA
jgi:hypothetical protein